LERSSNSQEEAPVGLIGWLDRLALGGLALGLVGYALPFWHDGRLTYVFWLTLTATLLHVYTSHARPVA
jgi:hypothetical protein